MSSQTKEFIQNCVTCQVANTSNSLFATLCQPNPAAGGAWKNVSMGLCGPLPNGDSLLVVVDTFSRCCEVFRLRKTTLSTIIPCRL